MTIFAIPLCIFYAFFSPIVDADLSEEALKNPTLSILSISNLSPGVDFEVFYIPGILLWIYTGYNYCFI
jgi:hypothetical protein